MMKILSKNVVVSLVVILVSLFILAGVVNATDLNLMAGANPNSTSGNTTVANDVGGNGTVTPTTGNTLGNVQSNIVKINDIGSEKDLPQTGENDIYMITAVGIAAVVIGSIAYVKSKKYDM